MRGRNLLYLCLFLIGVTLLTGYCVWAGQADARIGLGWQGLSSAWPFLLAGVLTIAVVVVLFARLMVISAKRGYDDRANPHDP